MCLAKSLVALTENGCYCNLCQSSDCIHPIAFQQCLPFETLETINATCIQNTQCYIIGCAYIVLSDINLGIHIYLNEDNKWHCESCERVCKVKAIIRNIPEDIIPHTISDTFKPKIDSECISNTRIPFNLSHSLSIVYSNQKINGFDLPDKLYPENLFGKCTHGFDYPENNLKLENTGIIVYLQDDIRQFKEYQGNCFFLNFYLFFYGSQFNKCIHYYYIVTIILCIILF